MQLIVTFDHRRPGDAACDLFKLSKCIDELQVWNNSKTVFFVASSLYNYYNSSLKHMTLHVGGVEIKASPSIINLGVVFDHEMKMSQHVTQISRTLNFSLAISIASEGFLTLMLAIMLSEPW